MKKPTPSLAAVMALIFLTCFCPPLFADTPQILEDQKKMNADNYSTKTNNQSEGSDGEQVDSNKTIKDSDLRFSAIAEAGTMLGIQTAVKHRHEQINETLESIASELDAMYDFSALLEHDGRVQPPIITEVQNALQIKSAAESISSQVVYKIIQDAKIVSTPPNWRSYLLKSFTAIEDVNPILLPRTDAEQRVWSRSVEKGWHQGVKQAERVFDANLSILQRDYLGLLTYKHLALQNIISVPMVAEGELGIKIRNKTMDVDQRVFRITGDTSFNKEDKWKPVGHIQKNQ
ncbi:MAG: type IV secretion system DotC family protein [Desulfobacteraceae bacterium]|nr:type IV secretion system DotC family protein [Desulfobacteraceae bacterium]